MTQCAEIATTSQRFAAFLSELCLPNNCAARKWFAAYERSEFEDPWDWYNAVMSGLITGLLWGQNGGEEKQDGEPL